MKILRVITRLDGKGGAEASTVLEVERLSARGHVVTVVTVTDAPSNAVQRRLEKAAVGHHHIDGGFLIQIVRLRKLIHSERPDLVHAVIFRAELLSIAATLFSAVPLLVSLVNMQYGEEAVSVAPSRWRLEMVRRFEKRALHRGADHFHCLTEATAYHATDRLGIPSDRMTVIPRGRDLSTLQSSTTRSEVLDQLKCDGSAPIIVSVGRQERQKGHDLLLDVAVQLHEQKPGSRVAVVGRPGGSSSALHERVAELGLDEIVTFLGHRDDVGAFIAAATVVCVTSRWEGLGGAVIEALALGAPIVAFGVPAVAEVVGDAGVIVAPFDVSLMANEIAMLIDDDDRRHSLSVASRRRFREKFELATVVESLEQLYLEVAASNDD